MEAKSNKPAKKSVRWTRLLAGQSQTKSLWQRGWLWPGRDVPPLAGRGRAGRVAGLGPGKVSCLSFPSQERGAEQHQLVPSAGKAPAAQTKHRSWCRRVSSCRSLLRTRAADGKENKVKRKPEQGGRDPQKSLSPAAQRCLLITGYPGAHTASLPAPATLPWQEGDPGHPTLPPPPTAARRGPPAAAAPNSPGITSRQRRGAAGSISPATFGRVLMSPRLSDLLGECRDPD